jgi:hypothetical protein
MSKWNELRQLIIDEHHLPKFTNIENKLIELGFQFIGRGGYGIVFAKYKENNKVSKIAIQDGGYGKYMTFCKANQDNPVFGKHLPKIHLRKTISNDPLVEYFSIEKLKHVPDRYINRMAITNLEIILDRLDEFEDDEDYEFFIQFLIDSKQIDSLKSLIYRLHHISADLDLHDGNYMIRDRETIVVTDPIAEFQAKKVLARDLRSVLKTANLEDQIENIFIIH